MKTHFTNGTTIIPAEWLNKSFSEDGGHKHDGVDSDGHAQKIDLNTEFTIGANASLTATADTGAAHDLTHAHAGAGMARILTGQLVARGGRVDLAPDATPSQRLTLDNLPRLVMRALLVTPSAWTVDSGHNVGALVLETSGGDLDGWLEVTTASPVDGAHGVVAAQIDAADPLDRTEYRVLTRWLITPSRVLYIRPQWRDSSGDWQDLVHGSVPALLSPPIWRLSLTLW